VAFVDVVQAMAQDVDEAAGKREQVEAEPVGALSLERMQRGHERSNLLV